MEKELGHTKPTCPRKRTKIRETTIIVIFAIHPDILQTTALQIRNQKITIGLKWEKSEMHSYVQLPLQTQMYKNLKKSIRLWCNRSFLMWSRSIPQKQALYSGVIQCASVRISITGINNAKLKTTEAFITVDKVLFAPDLNNILVSLTKLKTKDVRHIFENGIVL